MFYNFVCIPWCCNGIWRQAWGIHHCLRVYYELTLWLLVPCFPLHDTGQCIVHRITHSYNHLWVRQILACLSYHQSFRQHRLMFSGLSPPSLPKIVETEIHRVSHSMCHVENQFSLNNWLWSQLTHWGRVTHICVSKLTIIGSDNGLSPGRRQAIIWTNAGILLIRPFGTNFSDISIDI